jgi:hypothetical protein
MDFIKNMLVSVIAFGFFMAVPADAGEHWLINDDQSILHYVSVKKMHTGELHTIDGVSGTVSDDGTVTAELDMASVNSGIDVRDGRMKEMLYKIAEFPTATFDGSVDLEEFSDLAIGESVDSFVDGVLNLVGTSTELSFGVIVTRKSEDSVLVTSAGPIIIDAATVNLTNGIESLREIAQLESISYSVPVQLTIALDRN